MKRRNLLRTTLTALLAIGALNRYASKKTNKQVHCNWKRKNINTSPEVNKRSPDKRTGLLTKQTIKKWDLPNY